MPYTETIGLAQLAVDNVIRCKAFANGKRPRGGLQLPKPTFVGLQNRCACAEEDAYDEARGRMPFVVESIDSVWVRARRMKIVDNKVFEDPDGELIEFCMDGAEDAVSEVELCGRIIRKFVPLLTLE